MRIRSATMQDHEAVMGLMQFLHPDDPTTPASDSSAIYTDIIRSPNLVLLVAEQAGALLGSCYLNVIANLTRGGAPYAVIENVVTHPDFRKQGIGRQLMQHAVQLAAERQCYKIMLLTGRDESVQSFYLKCGFTRGAKTAFVMRTNNPAKGFTAEQQ